MALRIITFNLAKAIEDNDFQYVAIATSFNLSPYDWFLPVNSYLWLVDGFPNEFTFNNGNYLKKNYQKKKLRWIFSFTLNSKGKSKMKDSQCKSNVWFCVNSKTHLLIGCTSVRLLWQIYFVLFSIYFIWMIYKCHNLFLFRRNNFAKIIDRTYKLDTIY